MKRLLLLITIGTALGGCMPGPNYERPPVPEPPTYHVDSLRGESIANMPWWELFEDEVLQDLIRVALRNNYDLKTALARIAEARANVTFVKADLIPRLDYAADGSVIGTSQEDGSISSGTAFLDVFWEVDLRGRIRRSQQAAVETYLATEEAYRAVTISLVAEVATAYLLLRDLDNRLAISDSTVDTRQQSLNVVRTRNAAGAVPDVDVNQAEIQLAQAEASVQVFKRLRVQTENAISVLLGEPPTSIRRGLPLMEQTMPPEVPPGIPAELLARRPDILESERLLSAQTSRIGVAKAEMLPALTLSADLGATFESLTTSFASLGASLFGPLFNAGKNRARVDVEVARTQQLLQQYQQAILIAFREVEDAMVAVQTYQEEYAARQREVAAARSAARLSWVRYDGGLTSYLEVLEQERTRFNAQLRASETLQRRLASVVQLYKALGGGWNIEPAPGEANGAPASSSSESAPGKATDASGE